MNTYRLQDPSTVPLVVMPHLEANFRGYVALDLRSPDAPQIVWYYANAPSTASGMLQVDTVNSILQDTETSCLPMQDLVRHLSRPIRSTGRTHQMGRFWQRARQSAV